jgi:hypothetical protein
VVADPSADRRQAIPTELSEQRGRTVAEKCSNSAADFSVFDPHSQPESAFRENEWQSGAQNRVPKNG